MQLGGTKIIWSQDSMITHKAKKILKFRHGCMKKTPYIFARNLSALIG